MTTHYWGQMDEEPLLWFGRFWVFLSLGPSRSYLRVYKRERAERDGVVVDTSIRSIPHSWHRATSRWQWRVRAEAYDQYRLSRLQQQMRQQTQGVDDDLLTVLIALRPILTRKMIDMVVMPPAI